MVFDSVLPTLVGPIKEYVLLPTTRHISYAFKWESNVQHLQNELDQLKSKKDTVQANVDDATSDGEKIYWSVTRWLSDADKAIEEAEELVRKKNEAKKKCLFGVCPNLKLRYQISKKAGNQTLRITRLYNDKTIEFISYSRGKFVPSHSSGLFPSRVLMLKQILDALKDPSLNMIGIYGEGGAGKTTLAKEVSSQAQKEESFEHVIMISVSRFPDLRRIQAEIAAFLGLKFVTEEVVRRARQLYERLMRGHVLIVLDDVWRKLDLHSVGIPIGEEGCKLLVSSRSKDVLSCEMGSQKDFLVDLLSEEESWSLFQTIFWDRIERYRRNSMAIEMAKRCAGVPLLVNQLYVQLRDRELDKWADMLEKLPTFKKGDLPERVREVLESSFETLLRGKMKKSLILLCASYEQPNVPIQHLMIHGMGLRLFTGTTLYKGARSEMYRAIHELQKHGWLLEGDLGGHVRLHDVVRNAAISIGSRYHNYFVGKIETRFRYWPNRDCTRISLRACHIQDLPASLQCPKAELFLLSGEDLCLEFSDLFFQGLAQLQVVGFTGVCFATRLPSSLGCLRNLLSLSFHRCRLGSISVIGELTQLKFLSFAESDIVELPREIGALAQLRLLDLTNCSKLQVIPMSVISKLVLLEELYMRNTCVRWDEEGNARLMELGNLSHLSCLEIQVVDPKLMPKLSSFYEGLHSYKIIVGEEHVGEIFDEFRMLMLVKLQASIHLEDVVKAMSSTIQGLYIDEVSGMGNVVSYLTTTRFPHLWQLYIRNNCTIQHLTQQCFSEVFHVLDSLCLDNLNSLETIIDEELYLGRVKVSDCGKLKNLFSFSNANCLSTLEEMEVESCENMEAIISGGCEDINLSKLTSLKLKNLPHLKGICNNKLRDEKTGLLFHDKIIFASLKILEVEECRSLKYVFTSSNTKWLQRLERLQINDCDLVEEIIWHKESEEVEEESIDEFAFHKLSHVSLKKLPHLKSFTCGYTILFPSLVELHVHNCPAMVIDTGFEDDEHLFGETAIVYSLDATRFPSLMDLHIQNGDGIQYTFNLRDLKHLECLYFEELRSLIASNCNNLKNLFSFSSTKCSIIHLLEMEVRSCHKMEAIVGGRSEDEILEFAQLRSLKLENLQHLVGFCEPKEGTGQPEMLFNKIVSFPNLTSLVVDRCNTLKYVFTLSMVQCLVQLTKLEISNCKSVEAIILRNEIEENKEEIINKVVFRKLDSLSLYGIPNAKMFGCGFVIEFPSLRELSLECPSMENFMSKISGRNHKYNGDEYLFNEMVSFCNLESVIVRNMNTFRYLWHEKFILDDSFLKLKSLKIANCSGLSVVFPANAFRRIQKLEKLYISYCDGMEEIFQFKETDCGNINIAEEYALRDVRIMNLASLKYVFPNTMAHSLFNLELLEIHNCNVQVIVKELQEMEVYTNEEVVDFPQLFSMKLKNLPYLSGFCNKQEQGFGIQVSFPILNDLELCECKNFKYVFTVTMVNSLMKLEKLEINNCELVEEIVLTRQFDEVQSIVFPKLDYLSLEKLPNLKTFDFRYPVEFWLLKELSISYCPLLKNFVSKYIGNESDKCLFNEMVTFSNLERMKVCHAYSFDYLWDEQFTADDSFLNLKTLIIEYCSKLSVVFPSNIYRRFQGLETLHLRCCSRVEEIYRCEGKIDGELDTFEAFSLQDLEIWNLPSLKYIWSTHQPGTSTFEYLQFVKVVSCKDLLFVFPKSIACRLPQLKHLKLGDSYMEFIIANTDSKELNVVAPQLAVLQLENLFQMRNVYKGPYTFKCPKLKQLDIYGCNESMNICSKIKSSQLSGSTCHKKKSLSFVNKKLIRNLEEVTLDDQGLKLILSVDLRVRFSNLKQVTLRSLDGESIPLLFGFLRRCSLKKLVFVESYLEEIFLLDDEETMPEHLMLQNLEVVGDDNLKHIFKKDSRLNPVLGKLLTLNVEFCESMINIAPSSASFENLTSLNISACLKMKNLVTAATAKSMKNLRELKVSKCPMMKEIVGNNSDVESITSGVQNEIVGSNSDVESISSDELELISFDKLKCLELYDLPTLNCFSSSTYDLDFPLLKRAVAKNCFAMKNFCRGQVETPKLRAINFQDEQCWEGDLNATIASQRNHGKHK